MGMEELQPKSNHTNGSANELPPISVETSQVDGQGVPPTGISSESVQQALQPLLTEIQALRRDFETKIKYDESKERQVDSLHRELQAYREGLHFKILKPMFVDLIAVYDDFSKLIEGLEGSEIDSRMAQMLENLKSFRETIADILYRNGVESYNVDGNAYVPTRQRVMQVIDTTDPTLDRQNARRIRRGFEYDGRVLRPEYIAVYRSIASKE